MLIHDTIRKLGFVNIKLSRPVDGTIKNVTVSKTNTGKYFVSVLCDVDIQPLSSCENKIGIDLGLKTFAKISNGKDIENPKLLQRTEKKIIKTQRELSRKQIGSKNRDKTRMKLTKGLREWDCPSCGVHHDRDFNASLNLLKLAM